MRRPLATQLLVIPKRLKLNPGDDDILIEKRDHFENLGFKFENSDDGILMTQVPRVGKQTLGEEDVHEMLFLLSESDYNCKPQKVNFKMKFRQNYFC